MTTPHIATAYQCELAWVSQLLEMRGFPAIPAPEIFADPGLLLLFTELLIGRPVPVPPPTPQTTSRGVLASLLNFLHRFSLHTADLDPTALIRGDILQRTVFLSRLRNIFLEEDPAAQTLDPTAREQLPRQFQPRSSRIRQQQNSQQKQQPQHQQGAASRVPSGAASRVPSVGASRPGGPSRRELQRRRSIHVDSDVASDHPVETSGGGQERLTGRNYSPPSAVLNGYIGSAPDVAPPGSGEGGIWAVTRRPECPPGSQQRHPSSLPQSPWNQRHGNSYSQPDSGQWSWVVDSVNVLNLGYQELLRQQTTLYETQNQLVSLTTQIASNQEHINKTIDNIQTSIVQHPTSSSRQHPDDSEFWRKMQSYHKLKWLLGDGKAASRAMLVQKTVQTSPARDPTLERWRSTGHLWTDV